MAAKGNRPRARWFVSVAVVAWRWCGVWPETARLRQESFLEHETTRPAQGAHGALERGRRDRRGCIEARSAEDKRVRRLVERARPEEDRAVRHGSCGQKRGTCLSQRAERGNNYEFFRTLISCSAATSSSSHR